MRLFAAVRSENVYPAVVDDQPLFAERTLRVDIRGEDDGARKRPHQDRAVRDVAVVGRTIPVRGVRLEDRNGGMVGVDFDIGTAARRIMRLRLIRGLFILFLEFAET